MNSNTKLIILRGNSGSGKTTTAKTLQKKFGHGTMLISQDVIRREMLYVNDGPQTEAAELIENLIRYGRSHCDIVILEGILNSKWYKRVFDYIASEFKDNIYAYYYDIPFEETLERHKTKPNCNDFGGEDMRRWWHEKELLTNIKETRITKDYSLDDTVNLIYNKVIL